MVIKMKIKIKTNNCLVINMRWKDTSKITIFVMHKYKVKG